MSAGSEAIHTTCPYCGVGCGLRVQRQDEGYRIEGDRTHPANLGRLCSKGSALGETLGLEGRLLHPMVHGQQASWGQALDTVAQGFARIIAAHGPDAVALYVSGQLLSEDYYVANKLMKGFIGSANIDTNSRLCMASTVAGQQRAFGADAMPGCYEDIELAELVVIVGSNTPWAHPVLYQRLLAAKQARPAMKLVVIDPRHTPACEIADLHLALKPGSDAWLFNGLLNQLRREDALDLAFMEQHLESYATAFAAARDSAPSIPEVARHCALDEAQLAEFFRLFTRHQRVVTLYSQGINQSSSGVDKVNAIINVHLASGRIGKPGCGPFSLTGQPNAMGGREVGGLASQLAAHMAFNDPQAHDRLSRFWQTERLADKPGLKAVELFQAIETGQLKAVWIIGTNPVVSLPDAERVRRALAGCELVVVSDCVAETETTALAHVLLPAAAWGEKDGTVTNSERRISRQRAFLPLPGEAQPDWWAICQVARRMGFAEAFAYDSPAAIFREHAALSGFENDGRRAFDISALAGLDEDGYARLAPRQWPLTPMAPQGQARLFADGRFFTPSGKARLVPIWPRLPIQASSAAYPLLLNTGRIRDQWHTMTRTGSVPRLCAHQPEPQLQMHPNDARQQGLADGQLVRIESTQGQMLARLRLSQGQPSGSVFAPIHWSGPYARQARVGALIAPHTDPISGQPEFKHSPVRVHALTPAWQGFLLSRRTLALPHTEYQVRAAVTAGWRYELADQAPVDNWRQWRRALLGEQGEWLEFEDRRSGNYRTALIRDGRLEAVLFVSATGEHTLPGREWLISLFASETLDDSLRLQLLAGRPAQGGDEGPMVCACLGVSRRSIEQAMAQGLTSVAAISAQTRAGSNCGSCLPEITQILRQQIERP